MAKFGTFKFGQAKFGTDTFTPWDDNICYRGRPLGTEVRRQINKEIIYRVHQSNQHKYKYFIPTNPQTAPQQTWRATFTNGVAAAKALSEGEKEIYRDMAERKKGQTWFTMFMREYLWEASHGA